MKRVLLIIIGGLMLTSCGKEKSQSPAAQTQNGVTNLFNLAATGNAAKLTEFIGLWESKSTPILRVGNSTRIMRVKFEADRMIITLECRYDDASIAYATATAKARLEANGDFTVLEKVTVESEPKKDPDCTADINPGYIQKASIVNGRISSQTPEGQFFYYLKIAD